MVVLGERVHAKAATLSEISASPQIHSYLIFEVFFSVARLRCSQCVFNDRRARLHLITTAGFHKVKNVSLFGVCIKQIVPDEIPLQFSDRIYDK